MRRVVDDGLEARLQEQLDAKDEQHALVRQAFEREYEQVAQGERVSKIIHETYIQEMKRFKDKLRQLDEQ